LKATEEVIGKFMRKNANTVRAKYEFSDIQGMVVEEPRVLLTLGDFCVQFYAVYFCPAHRRRQVRSKIITRVLSKIGQDDNVQIAYPHVEVVPYKHRPFESRSLAAPTEVFSSVPSVPKGKVKEEG
jgi:hypothetical protein